MTISPVSQNALLGIERGMNGLERNAAEIASADQMNGEAKRDVAAPLVESLQNTAQVESAVKVLQAEGRMLGALLDVKA